MLSRTIIILILLAGLVLPVHAHDPSAWGGLFRSRDGGETWFATDAGLFIGGALALAVSPRDANHLLYATDTRLLSSRNGGRDWTQEAGEAPGAVVYAVHMLADGKGAVASGAQSLLQLGTNGSWKPVLTPAGAAPARAFVGFGEQIFLAAPGGVFASDDDGATWLPASDGLPQAPVEALAAIAAPATLFAVAADRIWASGDAGRTWQLRSNGLPPGRIESMEYAAGLWTFVDQQMYVSEDNGANWRAIGNPLPHAGTSVRGIALDGRARDGKLKPILLATHRGVLRSSDAALTWTVVEGNLPVHLEAGLLVRDPHDAATLYAGFSLTPYTELRARASGANLLARLDPVSLAGGAAFLALLAMAAIGSVRRLVRARQ